MFLGMTSSYVAGGILAAETAILLGHGAMIKPGRLVTCSAGSVSFVSFFNRVSNGLPCKEEVFV